MSSHLRDAGAEILQAPRELDYFAPGYYSLGFRDPDGVPIEIVHRWDELPDLADAEQVGGFLAIGAGFFQGLLHVNENYSPQTLLTMNLMLPETQYAKPAARLAFHEQVLERLLDDLGSVILIVNREGPGVLIVKFFDVLTQDAHAQAVERRHQRRAREFLAAQ